MQRNVQLSAVIAWVLLAACLGFGAGYAYKMQEPDVCPPNAPVDSIDETKPQPPRSPRVPVRMGDRCLIVQAGTRNIDHTFGTCRVQEVQPEFVRVRTEGSILKWVPRELVRVLPEDAGPNGSKPPTGSAPTGQAPPEASGS